MLLHKAMNLFSLCIIKEYKTRLTAETLENNTTNIFHTLTLVHTCSMGTMS